MVKPLVAVPAPLVEPAAELNVPVNWSASAVIGASARPLPPESELPLVTPESAPVSIDSGFDALPEPPKAEVSEFNGEPRKPEEVSEPSGVPLNAEVRPASGVPPSSVDSEPTGLRPSPRLARELCSGPNGLLLAGGPLATLALVPPTRLAISSGIGIAPFRPFGLTKQPALVTV